MKHTLISLDAQIKDKKALRDEYAKSIKDKEHFSPNALRMFRKVRARLTRELKDLKHQYDLHPDNPKNF